MQLQARNKQFGPIKSYQFLSYTVTSTALISVSQSVKDQNVRVSDLSLGTPVVNYEHRIDPEDELLEPVIDLSLTRRLMC